LKKSRIETFAELAIRALFAPEMLKLLPNLTKLRKLMLLPAWLHPRIEVLDPNFTLPYTLKAEPARANARKLTLLPMWWKSNMEIAEPKRPKDRSEKLLPAQP
jgi:hypothetical protein